MLVELERDEAVRIIRMNNETDNRFTGPFIGDLNKALDEIKSDEGARAVVFTGKQEKFFSTGLDLNWIITQPKEVWTTFLLSVDALLHRVFTYPKPAVAAINGHAFAGGLFMALGCDWRVMREDRGWLCVPEIDLGIELPPGNKALIAHVIGKRSCEYLALTGKKLSGREGLAYGIVDELAPADKVMERALEAAKNLGSKNPKLYAMHKLGMRAEAARLLAEDDPPFIRALLSQEGNWG